MILLNTLNIEEKMVNACSLFILSFHSLSNLFTKLKNSSLFVLHKETSHVFEKDVGYF